MTKAKWILLTLLVAIVITATSSAQEQELPRTQREWNFSVGTQAFFNKETDIFEVPTGSNREDLDLPEKTTIKRWFASTLITAEYPLARDTGAVLVLPLIYQTAQVSSQRGSLTLKGRGIGDLSLLVERRFPELAKGTEVALSLGVQFPTGRAPFTLKEKELPTGMGFYQALLRASIRKVRVPLLIYSTFEFETAFSRTVAGKTVELPNSYGGEVGFFYTLGPEFTTRTALSLRRTGGSPRLSGQSLTESYLSQELNYNPGGRISFQGSVDVGLTDDSLGTYLSLTVHYTY